MPWWKPALVAEIIYLSMMVLMYPFMPFKWHKTHHPSLYTWPATVALYLGYIDWFLKGASWLNWMILVEFIAIIVAIPLWIVFIYMNRDWPLFHMHWWWEWSKPKNTIQENGERVREQGHFEGAFTILKGGKHEYADGRKSQTYDNE